MRDLWKQFQRFLRYRWTLEAGVAWIRLAVRGDQHVVIDAGTLPQQR